MKNFSEFCTTLIADLRKIETELSLDKRTSAEDQLKVPIHNFLIGVGETRKSPVGVFTEHRQGKEDQVQGVRLDMAVKNKRDQLVGHIELKATSKSANPYRQTGWSAHDKTQWKRLANHSNLLYTNGWEWTLLRHGAGRPVAHVVLDPTESDSVTKKQTSQLESLLEQFLDWKPTTPSSPRGLAATLAPLTRFLRDTVIEVITDNEPDALGKLYKSWAADLMPGATQEQFADSFAQTFAYALLLARVESTVRAEDFSASAITPELRTNGHRLIGSVLELMAQPQNRALVEGPISLLEATIGSVDVNKFTQNTDPWLYFYEDFLEAYDPKLRDDAGVFYTPVPIVEAQVRLLDEVLKTRFGRQEGLGDQSTNILDNAAGTATYPLAVARHVLKNSASPQDAARSLAKRLFAFELLVGPYSVAHMRLTQMLESTGIELGKDGVQVYLTNSLTDPGEISDVYQQISLWEVMEDINEENRKAGLVKNSHTPIRVILGNPPYDRGPKEKTLGRRSTRYKNVILEEHNGSRPLIEDFIDFLRSTGQSGEARNLYNSYVYFMRWAIWKACEQHKNETGVVSYITSSSYLRGPGFAGLREYMRRVFDEVWIIDLGGERRGGRTEENVFAIKTPVAIFIGIQHPTTASGAPKRNSDRTKSKATVYYRRVTGTRSQKLAAMATISTPAPGRYDGWEKINATDWGDKFVPSSAASLSDGVPLKDIFPWYFSGSKAGRKWVIAPSLEALRDRIRSLQKVDNTDLGYELFDNSSSGRTFTKKASSDLISESKSERDSIATSLGQLSSSAVVEYGYRSFDRQYCIADHRLIDRPGAAWGIRSNEQIYLSSITTKPLGTGPAVTTSPYVPDMNFFNNRGGKDVFPLYRTDSIESPNISEALLSGLSRELAREVSAFEVAAYVVGLLGTSAYTEQFVDELEESVAHVPFTSNVDLFDRVVSFGRSIIFEQTWGERGSELNEFGQPTGQRFKGSAVIGVASNANSYPESWSYDSETRQLSVGTGRIDCVAPEVMQFKVSGMNVVGSWLGYRMKNPAGDSSSPLDRMQATTWQHDTELLELLWQIEFMISTESDGMELIQEVLREKKISPSSLGLPTEKEREAPPKQKQDTIF